MATSADGASDPLQSNPILQDISSSIAHILHKICSQSKSDIVDQLVEGIDGGDLQECKEYVFKVAVGIYDEQLEAKGLLGGRARLELKQRRGETVNEKCASAMVESV